MARFPKGTVTFLVATISASGSGEGAGLLRTVLTSQDGVVFHADSSTIQAVFRAVGPALEAALEVQHALQASAAPADPAGVAIALHNGPTQEHEGVYFGPTLNRVRSIAQAAHPGQILLSNSVQTALQERLPAEIQLLQLGEYRLNDLCHTEPLWQVVVPSLPASFPPLKTLDRYVHNLPVQDSPLIGREEEVSTACQLVQQPTTRLVTLLGSSGMGKTRLALQVAVEVLDDFADGVYFVALAPVSDPALLLSMIAQVLGVKEQPSQPLLNTLTTYLQAKHMLLVLDNFEQIWAAAPTISQVLAATQHVTVLVTSQVILDLEHEAVFAVPPLSMPDPSQRLALSALSQIPAVALFVERARDVQPSFALTALNAPAVIELCTRLEGLPLALELVAAQSRRYFPGDMLIMLQNRLSVARTIRRGNTREDTLRPVLDWICEVLGADVTGLFARLGVFTGGCTAESASAICNPSNDLALDVNQALNVLVANHLLLREELKEGRVRYTMLDAIHDDAQQRLTRRREVTRLQTTHASYYTSLAETAEPLLRTSEQGSWLARLEDEHHNLRTALSWSLVHQPEQALRLSGALWRFWYIHGHLSEGRQWLQVTLDQTPAAPPANRAKGLHGLGVLTFYQGDHEQAQIAYEAALEIRRELGDTAGIVASLNNLGILIYQKGDFAQAARVYDECLPLWRELDDQWGVALTLSNLGLVMLEQAEFANAAPYFQESLMIREQLEDSWGRSLSLYNLGLVAYHQGDFAHADELFSQSLMLAQELDDDRGQAFAFEGQAFVAIAQSKLVAARRLLADCVRIRHKLGDIDGLTHSMEVYADLLLAEGQPGSAVTCLGVASTLNKTLDSLSSPLQQLRVNATIAGALTHMSQAEYDAAWQQGLTTPLNTLLDTLISPQRCALS